MTPGDAHAVPHCDDGSCSLGRIEYVCPVCLKGGDDYGDLWWDHETVYSGAVLDFACERCGAALTLRNGPDGLTVAPKTDI